MLEDTRYGLVYENRLIKRRSIDGSVQDCIQPESGAGLPDEVPLAHSGPHRLHPDASMALPLAFGLIPADSRLAARTLECLETLWEQAWTGGGYGRYDVSSEPDSPGAWPFPSLFIARAYAEAGKSDRIRKILRWLDGLPGAPAGSWFEFYGPRISPPFPQVGIPPWTWAEMLILCVRHILGVRPERDALFIRPRLLDGMHNVTADLPIRGHRIRLHIVRRSARNTLSVQTEASVVHASPAGVRIRYGSGDTNVNIQVG